ncbi:PHP domain-containing protein [Amedibacillus sp. YH-ame10]
MTTFDLHMHSCYSADGEKTPEELILMAKEVGLTTIALSDHNTPAGIDEMLEIGKQHDIQVIPAIEFDTMFGELEVHVLGYNMDYHQPYFENLKSGLKRIKDSMLPKRLEALCSYFHMDFKLEEIFEKYGNKRPWANIVQAILEDPRYDHIKEFDPYRTGGKRSDPQSVNFYWDLCCPGTPCYVHVEYPTLEETVREIHKAGGIAVLAHPWRNFDHREDLLKIAIEQGIDGMEAYSNYHNSEQNAFYENYCKEHNVLMTCGSDYHGAFKPSIRLGEYGYTRDNGESILQNFLSYIHKK